MDFNNLLIFCISVHFIQNITHIYIYIYICCFFFFENYDCHLKPHILNRFNLFYMYRNMYKST